MTFLEKLNLLMEGMSINKSKLSQISGVPYTTIDGFYKKGYDNAKISTIRKLAHALGVSIDYLIEDAPDNDKRISNVLIPGNATEMEKNFIRAWFALPTETRHGLEEHFRQYLWSCDSVNGQSEIPTGQGAKTEKSVPNLLTRDEEKAVSLEAFRNWLDALPEDQEIPDIRVLSKVIAGEAAYIRSFEIALEQLNQVRMKYASAQM